MRDELSQGGVIRLGDFAATLLQALCNDEGKGKLEIERRCGVDEHVCFMHMWWPGGRQTSQSDQMESNFESTNQIVVLL